MAQIALKNMREITSDLTKAGFFVARNGKHTVFQHPAGVSISVPTSHKNLSYGLLRKVNKAIEETK